MNAKSVKTLSDHLGYTFQNIKLLELACVHKSFGNEHRAHEPIETRDNERLEFLGDAILDFVISKVLLDLYPESSEGDLSKLRAGLVNEKSLSRLGRDLKLGEYLWLGKGEEHTGGRDKDSILASTLEAVIAAIFMDGGFSAVEGWVKKQFDGKIESSTTDEELQDYKTKLQEVVQAKYKTAPKYEVIQSTGPDHDKTFEVRLLIQGSVAASAIGKSKKEAEQNAAKAVFEKYGPHVNL